jgi:selenocysteine lyase/cysteine desulfurase
MASLRHTNGAALVQRYGPDTIDRRGGTIAFTLQDPRGEMFDVRLVAALSNAAGISLRTGCFCNPGASENAFHMTREFVEYCSTAAAPVTYERYIAAITATAGHTITGAVRVSVGLVSNFADVFYFSRFLNTFLDMESLGLLH